jgi:hypothetical protein
MPYPTMPCRRDDAVGRIKGNEIPCLRAGCSNTERVSYPGTCTRDLVIWGRDGRDTGFLAGVLRLTHASWNGTWNSALAMPRHGAR